MNTSREAFQALSQEIQSDLDAAAKRVAELQAWASDEPEGIEMYAVAFLLQGLYAAIEAILQRSVKLFDGPLPQGEDWHIQLLNAAAQEVTGRPVILRNTIPSMSFVASGISHTRGTAESWIQRFCMA